MKLHLGERIRERASRSCRKAWSWIAPSACVARRSWTAFAIPFFMAIAESSSGAGPPNEIHTRLPTQMVIAATVERFMKSHPADLGVSLGVISDGLTYTFADGKLASADPAPPTAATLYPIASLTKTFTAALLAQASIDGKLHLDDDPRRYLDGYYPNLAYRGHPMRLFDLLDHRSGLPFFLPDKPGAQPDDATATTPFLTRIATLRRGYTNADFLRDLHGVTLPAIPGTEPPHYSNAGAELAGLILERLYAEPYSVLLTTKILGPLRMNDTCLADECRDAIRFRPLGYDAAGTVLPDDTSPLGAAGALRSSVRDLLKYAAWQMDEITDAVRISHIPRAVVGEFAAGLNWQMWRTRGRRLVWGSGNVPGFGSLCAMQMDTRTAVVILLNGAGEATTDGKDELANAIFRQLDPDAIMLPQ